MAGPVRPDPAGPDSLLVAYSAAAELGCHLALGWPLPQRILDLYFEFRHRTNGIPDVGDKKGIIQALAFFALPGISAVEKQEMRELILRGGPWSPKEREGILDYCESDVTALRLLLPAMLPKIRLPYALLRGRYAPALTKIERVGIPIDVPLFRRLQTHWYAIQDRLIAEMDLPFGLYEGRTFKCAKFAEWLVGQNLPWPTTETGQLDLRDDTFKDMARGCSQVQPIRRLRQVLSGMRLHDLSIGSDGFNRCFLNPFGSKTGRNQPSNSKFIFGFAKWFRGLIKPPEGYGVAYLDYGGQEFGIAAALSRDPNMIAAYQSGEA